MSNLYFFHNMLVVLLSQSTAAGILPACSQLWGVIIDVFSSQSLYMMYQFIRYIYYLKTDKHFHTGCTSLSEQPSQQNVQTGKRYW